MTFDHDDPMMLSVRAGMGLVIVLCLIVLTRIILNRLQNGTIANPRQRRLGLVEGIMVDGKRRLLLIRRDDQEHLLLLGPEQALVIEHNITSVQKPDSQTGPLQEQPL